MAHLTLDQLRQKIKQGKALICFVDLQDRYLNDANINDELVTGVTDLISHAQGKIRCLHVGVGADLSIYSFAYKIPEGDPILFKCHNDAFHSGELNRLMDEWGTDTLILAGMKAELCVLSTGKGGKANGKNVIFLSDLIRSTQRLTYHFDTLYYLYKDVGPVFRLKDVVEMLDATPHRPIVYNHMLTKKAMFAKTTI
ncbi:MAG: isochorismatase family protein [Alphaproteobacteria bacterium]|nr:isochorismatase family protein [Alphaproteobacteria bacterium]